MCASAGIYGEEAGVEADTGRGKGNDGSENLPKLQTLHLPENKMQELRREFTQDDHGKWYENHPNSPQMSQRKKNWDDIRNRMQTEMETFSKEAGEGGETLETSCVPQNQNRYNYKRFLRKFSDFERRNEKLN